MGRRSLRLRILTMALGGVLLLTTEGLDLAVAHQFDAGSEITLRASRRRVRPRRRVVLSGKVNSAQPECFQNREVILFGKRPKKTRTSNNGSYKFVIRPRRTRSYVTGVVAEIFGAHPHRHACGGDTSNKVKVRVIR
jgi:hypothetical protein